MKRKSLLVFLLISTNLLNAQLYISTGSTFWLSGNTTLTLHDADLVNHGSFMPGLGTVHFTGDHSTAIIGSQYTAFNNMEINKTGNDSVRLFRNIFVSNSINFISGHIDLNGSIVDLGITGELTGEKESSRICGIGGGYVVVSASLNNPVNANPGNLGALLSSNANMGNVLIRRGHRSQNNSYGLGYSIQRYFDIIPSNNNNLNATLRFTYFNSELNAIPENTLVCWSSQDNTHWKNEGFTSRDANLNYIEKAGIASFSRWTLSDPLNQLPVKFISFDAGCTGSKVLLSWKTAWEQTSLYFTIERSINGSDWITIGRLPAAGNSSQERSYAFTDNLPMGNTYYRIVELDLDEKMTYTNVVRTSCYTPGEYRVWPNPFSEKINIQVFCRNGSAATLKLFSSNGALVKKQQSVFVAGNNQLTIPVANVPAGIYFLSIETENGEPERTIKLLKK